MNKTKLSISILVVLLLVSISISFILYKKNEDYKSLKTKSENQDLGLIENENTKNLNKLPEGWTNYKNAEYGFQINYPETFNGNKIEVKDVKFKNRQDLAATGQEKEISTSSMGSYRTVREIIDFNSAIDKSIDRKMYKIKDSLFAIGIHPNESNLPFEEFVSQEILSYYKGNETIKNQKIIEINGTKGYKFVYNPTEGSENVTYYFPLKDGKTIISINTSIELLSEVLKSDDILFAFSKINPQFKTEFDKGTFLDNGYDEFLKKYPDYKLFEKDLSIKHLQEEQDRRFTFEQIVGSLKF